MNSRTFWRYFRKAYTLMDSEPRRFSRVYHACFWSHMARARKQGRRRVNQQSTVDGLNSLQLVEGLFRVEDVPQPLIRMVLRQLYFVSPLSQATIGQRAGGYSQATVSRMLNPLNPDVHLRPQDYRRWLGVFLTPEELARLM